MGRRSDDTRISDDAKLGKELKLGGAVLIGAGILWITLMRLAAPNESFVVLNLGLPALLLGLFLRYRGKQYLARSYPAEMAKGRSPVLYLRRFSKDAKTIERVLPGLAHPAILLSTFSTFEEGLAEAVRPIGPFVALADPAATLQAPGAARFQPAGAEWTVLVSHQLIAARLVIIRLGESEALHWELQQALHTVAPTKLLLLFHGTPKHVKVEYSYASHLLKDRFGVSLPDFVAGDTFVAFDKDWKARRLPLTGPFLRIGSFDKWRRLAHYALAPVFRELGVEWKPLPVELYSVVWLVLVSLLALFFALLLIATVLDSL